MPAAPWSMRSSARSEFAPERDGAPATPRPPAQRRATPIPPGSTASFFRSSGFALRHLVGQHAHLLLIEHGSVDHADQHLLDGAVAEPVDDALHGLRRDAGTRFGRVVDI